MSLAFSKYSGCGNDFILIDNRLLSFPDTNRAYIATLCHRQYGIGADGLILLEPSQKDDFRMRIFNADGGEAEMCGNGIRCLMQFIRDKGGIKKSYRIQTMHASLCVEEKGALISTEMAIPRDMKWGMALFSHTIDFLNTGVPHAVIFVDDLDREEWMQFAPSIRFHPTFGAAGTNVNFACLDTDKVRLRTYERGVEGETLACGTGATATALAAAKRYGLQSPVQIFPSSSEALEVSFSWQGDFPTEVALAGPVRFIFSGIIN